MTLKVWEYKNCGTCRKALKYLDSKGADYQRAPIREQPPSATELRQMLKQRGGEIRQLFNTSGVDYRAMNLKDKLPAMSEDEAITLLASNGNLIKRPFVLGPEIALVGFKQEEWDRAFEQ